MLAITAPFQRCCEPISQHFVRIRGKYTNSVYPYVYGNRVFYQQNLRDVCLSTIDKPHKQKRLGTSINPINIHLSIYTYTYKINILDKFRLNLSTICQGLESYVLYEDK